jgi:hypothetical protein
MNTRWIRPSAWKLVSIIALLAAVPIAINMALAAGVTWDEEVQREYGDHILSWYRTGFKDENALYYRNLYLYGGLFELPAQWLISTGLLPWGPYESRHVLTALVALLGCVAVWLGANAIAGPRAGFFAAALLALTPTWLGHGLFNSKDIPFGTAAAFVAYATAKIAMRRGPLAWHDALLAAVSLGAALGVRVGGMFLVLYPVLASYGRLYVDRAHARLTGAEISWRRAAVVVTLRWLCVVPVIALVMLSAWPWALQEPLTRPFEAAAIASHFDWGGVMRWNGREVNTRDLPLRYLPVWFKVTLPDIYLLALGCGALSIVSVLRTRRVRLRVAFAVAMLAIYIVLPFIGVIVKRPVIYDGHRHFLFVMPGMAMLAGVAVSAALRDRLYPRFMRSAIAVLAIGLASVTLYDEWSLHPFQYVYFNRMSGGLRRQARRFETDYWGTSYREGFEWVVNNLAPEGNKRIRISSCHGDNQLSYYRKLWNQTQFVVPKREDEAEIYLAFTRTGCQNASGELIHNIERQGVRLLSILRRTPVKKRKGK